MNGYEWAMVGIAAWIAAGILLALALSRLARWHRDR